MIHTQKQNFRRPHHDIVDPHHGHLPRQPLPASPAYSAATVAHAVDWSGYISAAALPPPTVSGESRQVLRPPAWGWKYRLGNECDFPGEFQLAQAMKADGVDVNAVLMTNYYSPATESNKSPNVDDNFGVEMAYVEMKGIDFAPQTLFWMGKRRDRDDVHIVDTFFTNVSGVGAGFNNVDLGFGKFGFSGQGRQPDSQERRTACSSPPPAPTAARACMPTSTTSASTPTASCA